MVRFHRDAAWKHRKIEKTCHPLTDTLRCISLETIIKRRVIAISRGTEHLSDSLDLANHIDGSFGTSLAHDMSVDGASLCNSRSVYAIFIDWHRFNLGYARDAYPSALDMIREMGRMGVLAPGCVVYLPILHDQTVNRLNYRSGPYTHDWSMTAVGQEDNPLWTATTKLYPSHSIEEDGKHLNQKTPFARFEV
jgi:hypothetical protein